MPGSQHHLSLFQQRIPPPTHPSAKPFPSKRPSSRSSSEKVRGCAGHLAVRPAATRLPPSCPRVNPASRLTCGCPLCVTQVPKAVTCLFITCPRSSGTRSSRRCSCLSAMSSLPKSLWTVPPTRVNALVSPSVRDVPLSLLSQLGGLALPDVPVQRFSSPQRPQLGVPALFHIPGSRVQLSPKSQVRGLARAAPMGDQSHMEAGATCLSVSGPKGSFLFHTVPGQKDMPCCCPLLCCPPCPQPAREGWSPLSPQ